MLEIKKPLFFSFECDYQNYKIVVDLEGGVENWKRFYNIGTTSPSSTLLTTTREQSVTRGPAFRVPRRYDRDRRCARYYRLRAYCL